MSRPVLAFTLVLLLAAPAWGDEKALVDQFNHVVSLFNQKKYAECRAAAAKFLAAAEQVKPQDPSYDRAQKLLKNAREIPAKTHHNAYADAHNQAQAATKTGRHDEAVEQWTKAVAEAAELHKLQPKPGTTDKHLADARTALARSQQLLALAAGQPPDSKVLPDADLPKPTLLSPFVPSFSLPRWDQPRLFTLGDLPARALLVIQLGTIETANDQLALTTLRALRKQHGNRLHLLTVLLEVPKVRGKLDTFLKEHADVAAVAGDDHGEFRQHVLPSSLTYPAYVLITPDRRALMLAGQPEELAVALARTVAAELARELPPDRPRGPVPYYPKAPPVDAKKIGGGMGLRFGERAALVIFCDAGDRGGYLKALSDLGPNLPPRVDALAIVRAPSADQAAAFARDKQFTTWWARGDPPAVYGPHDRDRLVLVSSKGHILKVLPLFTNLDYGPTLQRYAELLSTAGALPADIDSPARPNLASRVSGGAVVASSAAEEGSADSLIDGRADVLSWRPGTSDERREVHVSFLAGQPTRFDRVVLDNPAGVQDVELLADDRTLGRFRLELRPGPQAFPVPPTSARSLKVRLLSVYEGKEYGLGEIAVEEAADVRPALPQRLVAELRQGFTDEFAQGRLTFWEQTDILVDNTPPVWVVREGKLTQPDSARAGDHRATALLHAATVTGDFRLRATLRGHARAAGLIFGFRDWDNFDRLLVLEGQSQAGRGDEINSVRLERSRAGRLTVLSVHGESAPYGQELRLEIIAQGGRLAVTLQGQVIMNLADGDPAPGRAGLFTAGSHGMTFEQVSLASLTQPQQLAEVNPLSTAAGASIVWLSGQHAGPDDAGWAYHLLRHPVLTPAGAWQVTPVAGQPPEVVLAFRDAAEVSLEEIGLALPPSTGTAQRDWTRRVEVLVTRDTPLDSGRFQSVGTFDLAQRPDVQTFRFPQPVACRYVMLRLLANHGGSYYTLARVTARLGVAPPATRTAVDRHQIEKDFTTTADAMEREPNDIAAQATPLHQGKTVAATIAPGELDLFRLPDPPAHPGRATLRLQLTALPWLRLNADVLDDTSSPLAPLSRVSAGQSVRVTRSSSPLPRYVKVQQPGSALSFVMDNSGSMGGREDDVRIAVQHFLEGVAASEEVEVLRFESKVVPLVPFTRDRAQLAAVSKQVHMNGNTALYQALTRAMTGLADRAGSRAIVLLSDGMNTVPGADFPEVCRRLRAAPVPIYVIGLGWDLFEYDAASGNTCHDLLRNLALATGGRFYFAPTADQLNTLYREIAGELRGATRYRLHAEWEVVERNPELIVSNTPRDPRPLLAAFPPVAPELAESTPPTRMGPHTTGLPPAPLELTELITPPPALVPGRLPLAGATELIDNIHSPAPLPARLPLPGTPELAEVLVSPPTLALAPLPTFGRLELRYRPKDGAANADSPLPPAVQPAFLLILDSSGSMAQEIGGEKKYVAARRVLNELLRAMPDDAVVGLRLFGISRFWKRGQEPQPDANDKRYDTDSDLVVGVGRLDATRRDDLRKWIDWATPTGGTPLCYSLIQGLQDFPTTRTGPRTVVLVSDGMESQGGKLEDVARAYGTGDTGLVIHVVGFDVGKAEEQTQLKALARLGRGNFYNAADARQLADALRQALRSARFVVHDAAGQQVIARGDVNGDALDLPAGPYRVSLPGTRVEPLAVQVGEGKHLRVAMDGNGKLSLTE